MIVYNISLLLFFFVLFQTTQGDVRSMGSLGKLNLNPLKVLILVISICSMAGVPPLFGFFTKLLIMIIVCNSPLTLFFIFFITLLLVGLYFYVQNIRFLYNDSSSYIGGGFSREVLYFPTMIAAEQILLVILLFGITLYDDFVVFLFWIAL